MRGGEPHDLVPTAEQHNGQAVKYRCRKCGDGYQVRTTAPSCRIRFLVQMEQLIAPYSSMEAAPLRALHEDSCGDE